MFWSTGLQLAAIAAAIILSLWSIAYYRAVEDNRTKQLEIAMSAANIAETFQQTINDSIGQIDLVLKILRDLHAKHNVTASWENLAPRRFKWVA